MPHAPYVRIARAAGTGDAQGLVAAFAELNAPAEAIIDTLGRHTLIRQVLLCLPEVEVRRTLAPDLARLLEQWRARRWLEPRHYVRGFEQARHALSAEGVPVLMLKGLYFAHRLYGGLDRRAQHDIDLLVPRRDFRRAGRALVRAGFRAHAYDLHSRTYDRDDLKVDLHHCLRRAPAYQVDDRALWTSTIEVTAGPLRFQTLSDEWTIVSLLLAAFEDLGQGTARLKQLLDLFLLLREVDEDIEWDVFFTNCANGRMAEICVNVMSVVTALFDAEATWPQLSEALARRAHMVAGMSHDRALSLVFAPRKHAANLIWFGRIYPGSMALYLAWFWYGGFPENLSRLTWNQLRSSIQLAGGRPVQGADPVSRAGL